MGFKNREIICRLKESSNELGNLQISWEINHLFWQGRGIKIIYFSSITSAAVMLGKEVLRSFMVNSRTNTELFEYGYGLVATSQRGSVRTPASSWKNQTHLFLLFLTNWTSEKDKIKHDRDTVPDKINAEAPRHVIWTRAYGKCPSRQQIFLVQLSENMSDKTDYRTPSPVINTDIQQKCIE